MSDVDDIKSRLDIVDIVSEYVQLKKAGTNWKANCPFHHEKTPSFMVSKERQIFKCFGCGESGDIFSFLMKIEGLEFTEALKILADKAGVQLKHQDPQLSSQKNRLIDIMELTANYWHKILLDSSVAKKVREYLGERKIEPETIEEFKIGYSPDEWETTSRFLAERGFKDNEIFLAGLAVKRDRGSGFYDRFRGRLMFPIQDHHGNTVGFGGRILTTAKEAKYINTPQSLIYNKSLILYNLNRAKTYIKENDSAVMVEGYFDAIASWQAGVKNVVASSGTAMTQEQVKILKRYSNNLAISFDADAAGESASFRGVDVALSQDMDIRVISIPFGKDPDECVKRNPEDWRSAVKQSESIMDYFFKKTTAKYSLKDPADKKKIAGILLGAIAKLSNPIEQSHWLKRLAEALETPEQILRDLLPRRHPGKKETNLNKQPNNFMEKSNRPLMLEEITLALILKFPEELAYAIDHLKLEHLSDFKAANLYKKLNIYYTENTDSITSEGFNFKSFKDFLSLQPDENEHQLGNYADILLLLAEKDFFDFEIAAIKLEIVNVIKSLKREYLQKKTKDIEKEIIKAEKEKRQSDVIKLTREFNQFIQDIRLLENS